MYSVDVHLALFPQTFSYKYIHSLKYSVTSIVIPNWCCNDPNYIEFDFSRFIKLKSLKIGDDCFCSVRTFVLNGLKFLKTLEIGDDSFTLYKFGILESIYNIERNEFGDESKSFHILNCESLESIEIGCYSFSDFAGQFELKNLPALQSIQIGDTTAYSDNFYCSPLVIQGMNMAGKSQICRST